MTSVTFSDISQLLNTQKITYFDADATTLDIIQHMLTNLTSGDTIRGDTGLFIVDLSVIIDKYTKWMELLPRIQPFYAIKSNPNPVVVKVLSMLGAGFDCASKSEIESALEVCSADRIIFANPAKFESHLIYARNVDVDLMTFDNKYELVKISNRHPGAKLILRIEVDDSYSMCRFNSKFGIDLKSVPVLLEFASSLRSNICPDMDIVGVSFHVGSGCSNVMAYETAIGRAREVFDIGKKYGYNMHILDIGEGFPGITDPNTGPTFEEFAEQINASIDKHFSDIDDIKIIAEPGRYFCSASHTLVMNIVAKNDGKDENGERIFKYTVNDGVYGSMNCIKFDHAKPEIKAFNERNGKEYRCTVFGPTCDSMDTITENVMLPDLAIGECVYIENCGAYTSAAASQFNGFKMTPCEYIMRNHPHTS
jgi:ornithine decarboxylase